MKAWTALIFSAALAVLGAVPVLCFAALFVWQLATLFATKAWTPLPVTLVLPADWPPGLLLALGKLHVGVVPALLGLVLAALGAFGWQKNRRILRARKLAGEDRKRRVQLYRQDPAGEGADGRREPFIGAAGEPREPRRAAARG